MSSNQNTQAAAAWNAYTTFKAGRSLSQMNEADLAEALRLHEAFLAADAVVRVRGVNTNSVALAIDWGGRGELRMPEGGAVNIQATYIEGSPEALVALADWIEDNADYNVDERNQDASDYGTPFCEARIRRTVRSAELQAAKIRAAAEATR